MRLWLNRTGEVSLREQFITQVVLGILSRELAPGERLPSTRELARRFGIHANTASRAYRQLEAEGWLEFRHGSGVFVSSTRPSGPASEKFAAEFAVELAVDQLIGEMVAKARQSGAPGALIRDRLRRWLALEPPDRWLVIDPDAELRRILIFEMQQTLRLPVSGCSPEDCRAATSFTGALPVARPSKADEVRALLPPDAELIILDIRPIAPSMQKYLPRADGGLIAVASRWKDFLRFANTMLIAAGIAPESLMLRDATRPGWKRGLEQTYGIVCDAAIKQDLPTAPHRIAFSLLDEGSLARLKQVEDTLSPASPSAAGR